MTQDIRGNNKTVYPMNFYKLYNGPSNSGTCHIVFKLSTKNVVTTPRCEHKLLAKDNITIVNEIEKMEGIPEGIQF